MTTSIAFGPTRGEMEQIKKDIEILKHHMIAKNEENELEYLKKGNNLLIRSLIDALEENTILKNEIDKKDSEVLVKHAPPGTTIEMIEARLKKRRREKEEMEGDDTR